MFSKKLLFIITLCAVFAIGLCSCTKTEHDLFSSIHGIVSDSATGDPLGNATINLSPGGRTTVSGSDGQFDFIELDPGQYTITVQKEGYVTNRKTVTAISAEAVRADIPLTPQKQD